MTYLYIWLAGAALMYVYFSIREGFWLRVGGAAVLLFLWPFVAFVEAVGAIEDLKEKRT